MSPRIVSTAVLLSALSLSSGAFAADLVLAESLFREGRELMEKGDYAAACPKLLESFSQDASTGTLLALSLCQEQAGQTASAWAGFAGVITRARRDGRPDREQAARDHLAALEPKLSRLTLVVDEAAAAVPGLVVKRDGVALGRAAWGTASPVDPGVHLVEASAPGKVTWKGSITLGAAADLQSLTVPVLADAPAEAAAPAETGVSTAFSTDSAPARAGAPLRTIGLVVGGVGLVGLGVSGVFALRTTSLNKESKSDGCDSNNQCPPDALQKREDAVSAAGVATITLIAGGVLTAAGVTLFIVGGPKKPADSARLEATPAASPGFSGLLVRGQF